MTAALSAMDLAQLGAGFADPIQHSQQAFRALLTAQSRPGSLQTLTGRPLPHAPGLSPALGAALLTVLDSECRAFFAPEVASTALDTYLRFHTGVRPSSPMQAHFVVSGTDSAGPALWNALDAGSDEAPHASTSWWIDVPWLGTDRGLPAAADTQWLQLMGPGIRDATTLGVSGLGAAFWQWRLAQQSLYPCGIDLLLCCGVQIVALPRSTRITLSD